MANPPRLKVHSYSQPVRDDGVSSHDFKLSALRVREDRVVEVRGVLTVDRDRPGDLTKQLFGGQVYR